MYVFVFTLQHCISLKCGILTYFFRENTRLWVLYEDTHLEIQATPNHSCFNMLFRKYKIILYDALFLLVKFKYFEYIRICLYSATPNLFELQRVVYEKGDNFARCFISSRKV